MRWLASKFSRLAPPYTPVVCMGVTVALVGCIASVEERRHTAQEIAQGAQFEAVTLPTSHFTLAGFVKSQGGVEAVVYLEGDGFAWVDRSTVSRNPTPISPVALSLAVQDTSPTVAYVARPCQFVDLKQEVNCQKRYWTNARFAPEVIQSYHEVLDSLKARWRVKNFHLVGFSGGGAIAVLLAAQRDDIRSIRTIAGNLDHVALNLQKKVSPLDGSLNAQDVAQEISHIPQIHFSGSKDKTVPSWVATHFVEAQVQPSCTRHIVVRNATHTKGWSHVWKENYRLQPACR